MLGQQARIDAEHCAWLVGHVRTLHSKLRVLQAQLHVATYTSESVPALRVISDTLAAEEADARATIEQVSAQLLAYQECGPEFADIVWQYSQVKDELRKVEHALHHFSQLEMELADG
ncbi:MAG: HAUS augmin-like complex subunit 4 [Monoraphidium minutum]|nr:MAG: HAUS augmin-like complex subunit 4 [Monoraphidium minutum]